MSHNCQAMKLMSCSTCFISHLLCSSVFLEGKMELTFNMSTLIINWVIGEGSAASKIKSDPYLNHLAILTVLHARLDYQLFERLARTYDLRGHWHALGLCSIRCKFPVINTRYVLFYPQTKWSIQRWRKISTHSGLKAWYESSGAGDYLVVQQMK